MSLEAETQKALIEMLISNSPISVTINRTEYEDTNKGTRKTCRKLRYRP